MYCTKKITDDIVWVGAGSKKISIFEGMYPVPNGMSYNSFLIKDEKTLLMDTVDSHVGIQFLENLTHELGGRKLDYLVVSHMEPDHCALVREIIYRYPDVTLVCNAKTKTMLGQFFGLDSHEKTLLVAENDTLCVGKHTLRFIMAPMVHWPEVMVTQDETSGILFSADAFGIFGALNGQIFDFQVDIAAWLGEARRYYTNIVGKYGAQVQALLKKAATLDIKMICPLHGFIWTTHIPYIIEKYTKWSLYDACEKSVMIVYGSVYGNSENAAAILASKLVDKGMHNVVVYDVSMTHMSYIIADAYRCSHIVFVSPTYNNEIFTNVETVLNDMKAHNIQNHKVAVIENGTWAPNAGKKICDTLAQMKNMTLISPVVTIKSALGEKQLSEIDALADELIKTMN